MPFTTGILIGIGETRERAARCPRARSRLRRRYGHVQEVIVQNFRAKPGTKMAESPEPSLDELLWTIAVARLMLPRRSRCRPAESDPRTTSPRLLDAGIDDWGGVSPVTIDHVNPEAPWPAIALAGARRPARAGLALAPRLAIYPRHLADGGSGLMPGSCRMRCVPADSLASPGGSLGRRGRQARRPRSLGSHADPADPAIKDAR